MQAKRPTAKRKRTRNDVKLAPAANVRHLTLAKNAESNFNSSSASTASSSSFASATPAKSALAKSAPKPLVCLAYAVCALVWGTGWYAIRLCVGEGGYPVLGGAAIRYTLAAAVLLLLIPIVPKAFSKLSRKQIAWLITAGILNGTAVGLVYWGEKTISGGLAAVLTATAPIMAAVLAIFTRTEKISVRTIGGFCLALAGIAVIFGERLSVSPDHLFSMAAILGSALLFTCVNLTMKVKAEGINPLQSSLVFFIAMAVAYWLFTPCEAADIPWPPPAVPSVALGYLAFGCSVIAFPAFCFLLRHASLMLCSTLAFVHPVIALLTDAALETTCVLTSSAYIGIGIVLAGVLISMATGKAKVPSAPKTALNEKTAEAYS